MDPILKLFCAVLIKHKGKKKKPSKDILKRTIKSGFILDEEVIGNYSDRELGILITTIENTIGITGEQMNSSFHKSWKKVKDAPIGQLVVEQVLHYITTYGFEQLGIYDENTVYIPEECLSIPNATAKRVFLIRIKGYTKSEVKQKVLDILQAGIALKGDTIKDAIDVASVVGFTDKDVESISNREAKIALYDYFGMVPENPIELLRYVVFKATNKTLLIKDEATIAAIKCRNNTDIAGIINRYQKQNGLERLAEIFYRFKPLFLAFRTSPKLKQQINKIRKLAITHHVPMVESYLNTVTRELKNKRSVPLTLLKTEMAKVNTFRKIRLAYALNYRTLNADSILYKIRNGKGYATEFQFPHDNKAVKRILNSVLKSIVMDIKPKVQGKKIYIPSTTEYALPATEKQFTGMFPSGTCVALPSTMTVGVWWKDLPQYRVDLDLSLISLDEKIGWDGYYRRGSGDVLFSGDVTAAPNGAAEAFYIAPGAPKHYLLCVNYYNMGDTTTPVPFKIFITKGVKANISRDYIVDPNKIVASTESSMVQKQKALGIIVVSTTDVKFYFSETNIGKSITARSNEWSERARKYMIDYHENMIPFKDLLIKAGGKMVDNPKGCDIDLSQLEKDTFIKILGK